MYECKYAFSLEVYERETMNRKGEQYIIDSEEASQWVAYEGAPNNRHRSISEDLSVYVL